ncbi:MAG: hypothetical protein D6698_05630 [Gammaproteobacteria bacterium]|nr:MAG: hypothetical protein D6698_05630 [Gammaproteobacteria bacterium]
MNGPMQRKEKRWPCCRKVVRGNSHFCAFKGSRKEAHPEYHCSLLSAGIDVAFGQVGWMQFGMRKGF